MAITRSNSSCAALWLLVIAFCAASGAFAAGTDGVRITVLYDAFGKSSSMEKDWGYSALIEYRGKRILFDTGNRPDTFARNARAQGADLTRIDFVVLSHRHADHMGGMDHLLRVNPKVKIFAPLESFGIYGSTLPGTFYRRDESLAADQRYFDGRPPEIMSFGSAWPSAHFELVGDSREIAPGIRLISLVSERTGTRELRELSLAIDTPEGVVLVVGCSHPGIEQIVEAASSSNRHVHLIAGGLHLVTASDSDINTVVTGLRDTWKVGYIAPGHCTGEPAFAALKKAFGDRYLYAGLGTRLESAQAGP